MSELPVPAPPPPPELPSAQTLTCENCGAPLSGEYCSACGQRHEPHVHSMAHFASEAFESVTHADSRLWRTLFYLLFRPGFLTRQFFDGRRARYLPPFRLYLVISVFFFLVFLPTDGHISVRDREDVQKQEETVGKVLDRLDASASAAAKQPAIVDTERGKDEDGETHNNTVIAVDGLNAFCSGFLRQPKSGNNARNNLRENCRRLSESDGATLGRNLVHNVPRAMFVFLPLLALVMWLLYWRPKRYYVEHLLFLVHNHAFVFLVIGLLIVIGMIPHSGPVLWVLWPAACLYVMWYMFRAMRNVYQQGTGLTLAKWFFLGTSYIFTFFIMLLLTLLFTAMTL